ncbi:MAG TPA: serine/threonine-protein kinase, partial [Candidatus Dormibacteraeota bacterium]|nr:serine/threonine-protein kinase [Candidatus Dormibacteraeota bacterium]
MTGEQGGGPGGPAPTVDLGIPSIGPASEIGRGAAGVVYRAEQPAMNRTVAVKVLPFAALDEAARARFERECRAMGSVSGHAGIVTVYEAGFTPGGQPFILMELMDGGSLEQRLAMRGPFQWEEVVEIGVRLAGALEVAHRKGILHRDIKPDNVLVSTYGDAKLADFSIARLAGATKTQTGLVAATPAHAPPEVLRGEDPSVRGDVYSL